jgi:hypothetical protein
MSDAPLLRMCGLDDVCEPADPRANGGLGERGVAEQEAGATQRTRVVRADGINPDADTSRSLDDRVDVAWLGIVEPDQQMHARVLASNLDALAEMLPQSFNQGSSASRISGTRASQVPRWLIVLI